MAGRRGLKSLGFAAALFLSGALSVSAEKGGVIEARSGAVPFGDVLALAGPYPNLRQEIRLARIAAGGAAAQITCTGRRLGGDWSALTGRAIGPYRCRFGTRTLDIETRVIFYDGARHKLTPDRPGLVKQAKSLAENRLVWRWQ
jgi:hypothetical protein